jgi:hypothetical protein
MLWLEGAGSSIKSIDLRPIRSPDQEHCRAKVANGTSRHLPWHRKLVASGAKRTLKSAQSEKGTMGGGGAHHRNSLHHRRRFHHTAGGARSAGLSLGKAVRGRLLSKQGFSMGRRSMGYRSSAFAALALLVMPSAVDAKDVGGPVPYSGAEFHRVAGGARSLFPHLRGEDKVGA